MSDPITNFGQALRNWMWKQEPSWSGRKLALELGVGTGTVWNWLHTEKLPQENLLPRLARVTGISLKELYELCGYPVHDIEKLEETVAGDVWNYIVDRIVASGEYSDEELKQVVDALRKLQAEYEGNHSASPGSDKSAAALSSLMKHMLPAIERDGQDDLSPTSRVAETREHYTV